MKRDMLRFVRKLPASLLGIALVSACPNFPVQDSFRSEGGISPDPTGVVEGSILYIGPAPMCEYEQGKPSRVQGRVIMTMFVFDNPPPPEGTATTAVNFFALSGDKLFELNDCLPEGKAPDPSDTITRSVPFRWPQIALGHQTVDYQIRGFYDYDEDMNPFFSVSNLPTAGDIAGAALVSVADRSKGFLRIPMPAREEARDGHVERNVTVVLANYVWTERPIVKLSAESRQLDAQQPLPVRADPFTGEPRVPEMVQAIWELTCAMPGEPGCDGLSLETLSKDELSPTLEATGLGLDFDPARYAFFVQHVDVKTVVVGGADKGEPDGVPDPHPLLGATLPIPFSLPALILQRQPLTSAAAEVERSARIPSVSLVGALLPGEIATQKTFVNKMNVSVPPLAVVELEPGNTACRIPYVPPGNPVTTYEDRLAYCQDLPTGVFGPTVLHGVAGGVPRPESDTSISANGIVIEGGGLSGQVWRVPNEFADPEQVGRGNALASQGRDELFVVHDPEPDSMESCEQAYDVEADEVRPVKFRGICRPGEPTVAESVGRYGTPEGIDGAACLPQGCCDAVAHLCGLPLCQVVERDGLKVRASPTKITKTLENGVGVPDCIPFAIPPMCCEGR